MTKKLERSNDRVIAGVCAGIAEYLDFDPVAVRLGYAFFRLSYTVFDLRLAGLRFLQFFIDSRNAGINLIYL